MNHAQALRTLGQRLEKHRFLTFEISKTNSGYLVAGVRKKARRKFFRGTIEESYFERHYDREKIERLRQKAQRRQGSATGEPDGTSMSHLLRVLGSFLDEQGGSLIRIRKSGGRFAVELEREDGTPQTDVHCFESLTDLSDWVRQRGKLSFPEKQPDPVQISCPTQMLSRMFSGSDAY